MIFLNCISRVYIVLVASAVIVVSGASPVCSQVPDKVILNILEKNPKLNKVEEIFAAFGQGESETGVIVTIKPTAVASALAGRSRLMVDMPAAFEKPGAPAYYNLKDPAVRKGLRKTVTEAVGRVVDELGAVGMKVTQKFSYQFGFAARVTPAILELLVNHPDVVAVEPDPVLKPHLAQGIPLISGSTPRSQYDGSGVSIAICDTGIDTSHPRLGGGGFPNAKVIGGYDTGDNDADPRPNLLYGDPHGTACAGIAAGNTGTVGDYIGGVAPGAKLYALKISKGNTGSAYESALIAAWEWTITHQNDDPSSPIMIISTSFGGGGYSSTCDSASTSMTTAASRAVSAGITIFASSGNDGYCGAISWPACISFVNAVGAVYDADIGIYYPCVSSLSCAQKTATSQCTGWYASDNTRPDMVPSYSNSASLLALLAPANRAYTTDIVGAGGYTSGSYFSSFGGTSAASPYAAGAAAVLQSAAKSKKGSFLPPALVQDKLVATGDTVVDGKNGVIKPRINLDRAVLSIKTTTTAPLLLLLNK